MIKLDSLTYIMAEDLELAVTLENHPSSYGSPKLVSVFYLILQLFKEVSWQEDLAMYELVF